MSMTLDRRQRGIGNRARRVVIGALLAVRRRQRAVCASLWGLVVGCAIVITLAALGGQTAVAAAIAASLGIVAFGALIYVEWVTAWTSRQES